MVLNTEVYKLNLIYVKMRIQIIEEVSEVSSNPLFPDGSQRIIRQLQLVILTASQMKS